MNSAAFVPYVTNMLTLVIIFHKAIEGAFFNSASTMLDEVTILLLLVLACWGGRYSGLLKLFVPLIVFFTYSVLISLSTGYNTVVSEVMIQSFLHLQFIVLFLSLTILHLRYNWGAIRTFKLAIYISVGSSVVQLLAPGLIAGVVGDARYTMGIDQFGLLRLEGILKNPNALGFLLAMFLILIVFKQNIIQRKRVLIPIVVFLGACMVLTGSNSSLIFVGLALLFLQIGKLQKIVLLFLIFLIGVQSSQVSYMAGKLSFTISDVLNAPSESAYSRWMMAYNGLKLLIENFPIGVGVGSYGTPFSRGSVVYDELGISVYPSVFEGTGIQDSNIGAIWGEYGFLGFVCFLWILFRSLSKISIAFTHLSFASVMREHRFIVMFIIILFLAGFIRPLFNSSYYSAIVCLMFVAYFETIRNRRVLNG